MNRKEAVKKWEEIIQEVEAKKSELDSMLGAARQINEQLGGLMNDSNSKSSSITSVEQLLKQKSQEAQNEITVISGKGNEATAALVRIRQTEEQAQSSKTKIDQLSEKTSELLNTNQVQSEKVSDMLQKAAAGSLFNSFNLRKTEHEKSSKLWMLMIGISVLVLIGITFWIAHLFSSLGGALTYEFFFKFAVSFPVIYWLIFSTRQYVKTKRYEEEYAFKSAISLSLEAYRDLIKKESGEVGTKSDVIPFITEAVGKIFSSPSTEVANNPHREDSDIVEGVLDKISALVTKIKG